MKWNGTRLDEGFRLTIRVFDELDKIEAWEACLQKMVDLELIEFTYLPCQCKQTDKRKTALYYAEWYINIFDSDTHKSISSKYVGGDQYLD